MRYQHNASPLSMMSLAPTLGLIARTEAALDVLFKQKFLYLLLKLRQGVTQLFRVLIAIVTLCSLRTVQYCMLHGGVCTTTHFNDVNEL